MVNFSERRASGFRFAKNTNAQQIQTSVPTSIADKLIGTQTGAPTVALELATTPVRRPPANKAGVFSTVEREPPSPALWINCRAKNVIRSPSGSTGDTTIAPEVSRKQS